MVLGLGHDAGKGALDPLRVRDCDDGRLEHLGMRHDQVLEVDARDPFSAGLDDVLRAIGDLDVALGIDRPHVAGLEPAVLGEVIGRVRLVVAARDPRPAHLDLAHRLAVPWRDPTLLVDDAQVDADGWEALLGPDRVLLVVGPGLHVALEA